MPFKRKLDHRQRFKKQPGGAVKPWLTCQQIQLHHTRMCYQSAAVYGNILVVPWSPESRTASHWLTHTQLGVPQSATPQSNYSKQKLPVKSIGMHKASARRSISDSDWYENRPPITGESSSLITVSDHVYLLKGIRTCVLNDSVPITGLKSERAFGVSVGDV
jgi:hypothetical protein